MNLRDLYRACVGVCRLSVLAALAAAPTLASRGDGQTTAKHAAGQPQPLQGVVTATQHPMVALYSLTLPFKADWQVEFGPTTAYGLKTSKTTGPEGGGTSSVYVAGMQASTPYHMRAVITLPEGTKFYDVDHAFTTGPLPVGVVPPLAVSTAPGMVPQSGIELINTLQGQVTTTGAVATDLAGNPIWTYTFPHDQRALSLYPIKLLPNGHFLLLISPLPQAAGSLPPDSLVVLREIDLAGNTVQELSMDQLNASLATAGFADLKLQVFTHDVTLLPNGHILVLTSTVRTFQDLPGYPGALSVVGDVVVDLNKKMQPVWVWNEFDHFDINRHPMAFPDWTHSNAVVYSKDDGNFLVSLRHQNWVVKVNYHNGMGDGSVVWKLGEQGDFTLVGGTDPIDWFYAQHDPEFFSANTTGVFSLGVMDNGDDRPFPDGITCLQQEGYRCYTTIPILQVDEHAMTATLTSHQILPGQLYSSFAGSVGLLSNGHVEYNLAGVGANAYTFEVTPEANPQTVWQMLVSGSNTYRSKRLPSLYPGVQW